MFANIEDIYKKIFYTKNVRHEEKHHTILKRFFVDESIKEISRSA